MRVSQVVQMKRNGSFLVFHSPDHRTNFDGRKLVRTVVTLLFTSCDWVNLLRVVLRV